MNAITSSNLERMVTPSDASRKRSDQRAAIEAAQVQNSHERQARMDSLRQNRMAEQQFTEQTQQRLNGRLYTLGQPRGESLSQEQAREARTSYMRQKVQDAYSAPTPDYERIRAEQALNPSESSIDYIV